jgi:hypothetical protein
MIHRRLLIGALNNSQRSTRAAACGDVRPRFVPAAFALVTALFLQAGCRRDNPRVEITEKPLSLSAFKALGKGIDLPLSATNIIYAQATAGMGGRAILYRFSAPPEDCLGYAQRLATRSGGRKPPNHFYYRKQSPKAGKKTGSPKRGNA